MKLLIKQKYTLIAVLYALFILVMTSIPGNNLPPTFPGFDKIAHMGLYGLFSLIMFLAVNEFSFPSATTQKLFAVLFVISFGVLDELHQSLIPGRSCDLHDWLADFAGAVAAVLFYKLVLKIFMPVSAEGM